MVEEDYYDRIDQTEIDEIFADKGRHENNDSNPTDEENDTPENSQQLSDDDTDADNQTQTADQPTTRYGRTIKQRDILTYGHHQSNPNQPEPPTKKSVKFEDDAWHEMEEHHNLFATGAQFANRLECTEETAVVAVRYYIDEIKMKVNQQGASFVQQYQLHKGLKKFGQRGMEGARKEADQLHRRSCFRPVDVSTLTPEEKREAAEGMMLLTEKKTKEVKGRLVYRGDQTRHHFEKEDVKSPTVSQEALFLMAIIDAHERRDVGTGDVPNAFIQTDLKPKDLPKPEEGNKRMIMKITGVMVDMLVEIDPTEYGPKVVYENGKKVLYLEVLKAIYGMLIASLLWFHKLRKDLGEFGFKFNPYEPCVGNKIVDAKQQTVRFHVDDLMSSHVDSRVNDRFHQWLNKMYGKYGEVKVTRGKIHDYLGMRFDFSEDSKVKIDMIDYVKEMLEDFSESFKPTDGAPSPAADDLFAAGDDRKLDTERADEFHTFVAKGLWASKRARPDLNPAIAVLCTRVKQPTSKDWNKLRRMMLFLNGTRDDKLILSADDLHVIKWFADCSFAVHPDFKSHTGGLMTFGQGCPINKSAKQKLNTRSSTEGELVAANDMATMILWTKLFMEAQGYEIKQNILFQDNKSTILLENNGKRSSSQRKCTFNIRYFFLTDQIEQGNMSVKYCPTTEMLADYLTKPLQGRLFDKFRRRIMGYDFVPTT